MKILIAVHTYYPEKNGVQQVTEYIAEGLAQKNDVTVITSGSDELCEEEMYRGVHIKRLAARRDKLHVFHGERTKYLSLIKKVNPDIFICTCTQSWTFDWIKHALKKIECPKILYTHGYSEYEEDYKLLELLKKGRLNKIFTAVLNMNYYRTAHKYISKFDLVTYLCETDVSVSYAKKYNLTNGKILGNAVEDMFFEPLNIEEKPSNIDGIVRLCYIANYNRIKNQKMVLEAFYKANKNNAELVLCGSDANAYLEILKEEKDVLDKLYGVRKVEFLHSINREMTRDLFRKSDVYVCGSTWEAFSISLCEAVASGLAVISTNVGNASTLPEVILTDTTEEMAEKIAYLCDNREVIIQKGRAGLEYAKKNLKISEKITWMEQEIERLSKHSDSNI